MSRRRLSPLAVSMIWMTLAAVCLAGVRLGMVTSVPDVALFCGLISLCCFGVAVGAWFNHRLIGCAAGFMVWTFIIIVA